MKKAIAMILAGGHGQRMDILCQERPKPLLPFAGSLRIIDFSLSNCVNSGIGNIGVLVDHQRQHLVEYLGSSNHRIPNPSKHLSILEPLNGYYDGTADAVYQNLEYIERSRADVILVLAADHVYKMDYRRMLAFHERAEADITVGVISVPIEKAKRYGIASVDRESRIINFIEKPAVPHSNIASMGIYVFNTQVLAEILRADAAQTSSPHDFGYTIVPQMVADNRAFAYKFNGYWQDIGTLDSYYGAGMELCRDIPPISLNGNWPIVTRGNGLPPARVLAHGSIRHSIVAPGCVIRGKVINSILSPGVIVSEKAEIRNSIIMANTTIGTNSLVVHSILDEEVTVGEFCYIGFGSGPASGAQDITVLGRGVTVPSRTAISHSCKVLPDVGPLDFAASAIPAGAIVVHN